MQYSLAVILVLSYLCGVLTATEAEAQQEEKVYLIGVLGQGPPSFYVARFEAFRQELHTRGYIEGHNIRYEYRYAKGELGRLLTLATELVRLNVDVILTTSTPSTRAAMNATRTIPIVMHAGTPVESGLVASLARPGGNVTGVTIYSGPEFYSKRLELLKEIAPSASRVAVLHIPTNSAHRISMKALQATAPNLGMTLLPVSTNGADDIDSTLAALESKHPDTLVAFGYASSSLHRKQIVEFVAQNQIAAVYPNSRWMDAGGLMSYSVDHVDNARQKAIYVDKIIKGARPAELPIQRPRKYNLAINLKTANALGLTIPPEILVQYTTVIY